MKPIQLSQASRQRGAVLAVGLIFLLLLTVIGLSAVRDATLQERMAGNTRDVNTAFQAAELALRQAETYLQGATVGPFNGSSGLYRYCGVGDTSSGCVIPVWSNRASTGWVTVSGSLAGASTQPQYIIQKNPIISDAQGSLVSDTPSQTYEIYRITARGFGTSDGSMVVLQSTYRRG